MARCEACKGPIRQGRRFCTACAVAAAKRWNLDYFDAEPDPEEMDVIAKYERDNRVKTAFALAIIAAVGVVALWSVIA